ncbi:MAG: hypothetical protein KGZ25_04895, partial [Planctomycetes bacterium]|nr:hypothetical protein [Planctomycetota bacterium]
DTSIRCPLIVAGADAGSGSTDRLTCSLDFFPTFCDWAGIEPEIRPPLEGHSLEKVAAGENEPEPWDCVSVAFGPMESIISDDGWRLTVFEGEDSPNQLINLVEDPDEQHNLYPDENHSEARQQMLEKMSELHVRLRQAEQYRTLPVKDNARFSPGGAGNGRLNRPLPLYGPEAKRWAKEAPVGGSDES